MTQGIEAATGVVFGDRGFMGGGAAVSRLDSADLRLGTPPHALVVAKGVVIHPDYGPVNEDMLVHPPSAAAGGLVLRRHGLLRNASRWRGVFGGLDDLCWQPAGRWRTSSLGRLTANVLRRFRDPAPF